MNKHFSFSLIHRVVKRTIRDGFVDSSRITHDELKHLKESFSDYLMYIWMALGDTRCNKEGYTTASVMIEDHINNSKELNNAHQ